jgi:hypothetical protein
VPGGHVVDQGVQSTWVAPLSDAEPDGLQKPLLQTHAEMEPPPAARFEFAGHAVQAPVWPAAAYVPVPHAVHEFAAAAVEDCAYPATHWHTALFAVFVQAVSCVCVEVQAVQAVQAMAPDVAPLEEEKPPASE